MCFFIRCGHATVAGLLLVAVHFEFAAWFVSLAGVQLADGLFVCCVVAGCGRLVGVGYSVGACVSDLLCGKWLLVDRYVHHLLCGA